jgi:hypothetical protein
MHLESVWKLIHFGLKRYEGDCAMISLYSLKVVAGDQERIFSRKLPNFASCALGGVLGAELHEINQQ